MADIYGKRRASMERVMDGLVRQIEANGMSDTGEKLYEHLLYRIKSDASMREKLRRTGLDETAENALLALTDAISVRIVCLFIDYVYECVRRLRALLDCVVVTYVTISFIVEL